MHTSTTSMDKLAPWTAAELQQATQGHWYKDQCPDDIAIKRILTDSRHAETGDAFLALKGERFDAHDFAHQVVTQGCTVLIVERPLALDVAQLVVKDTRLALGQLGAYRRAQYPHLKMLALTGSSGKTTTKEMLGSILNRLAPTLITRGNLNNDLGVPMMLLELTAAHQFAVMELGANHQGEIDYTSQLVAPEVAGILNIGTAHLGEFGGREGIFQAKSEIYRHIAAHGIAIIPADDEFTQAISQTASAYKQLSFGCGGDVYAQHVQLNAQSSEFDLITPQGTTHIHLPFAGLHNVKNATAAAAFALAIGIDLSDIVTGLELAKTAKGRLNFIQKQQYLWIDDTYNANPTSMRAAAEVLAQQAGFKVLVVGDIGELGASSTQEHYDLGRDLVDYPIDLVVAVGEYAQAAQQGASLGNNAKKLKAFSTQADALPFLTNLIQNHQPESMSFLFKGSRYTHMETLMAALMEKF